MQNKDNVRHTPHSVYIYIYEGVHACVERVRQKQWGGGHIGGRLMRFSLRAPRGSVLREKPAYWKGEGRRREERRMRVLLFILTCSTQSLTLASQLRCCGSSAMYTKQRGRAARAHRWWVRRQKKIQQPKCVEPCWKINKLVFFPQRTYQKTKSHFNVA